MEEIGTVVSALVSILVSFSILFLGFAIVNSANSLKFFDDSGTVKIIKIFNLLAYFGGLGAAFVGKDVVATIGFGMAIVGYWVLMKEKS